MQTKPQMSLTGVVNHGWDKGGLELAMKKLKQSPSIVEFVILYLFILPYDY